MADPDFARRKKFLGNWEKNVIILTTCFENEINFWKTCLIFRFKHILPAFQMYQLLQGVYETTEIQNTLNSFVTIIPDEYRLKLNSTVQCDENEVISFDKKSFFESIWGFVVFAFTKGKNMRKKLFNSIGIK